MGVEYKNYNFKSEWTNSFDDLLSVLINNGEIDINDDKSLQDYACDDGFLELEVKLFLHISEINNFLRREK